MLMIDATWHCLLKVAKVLEETEEARPSMIVNLNLKGINVFQTHKDLRSAEIISRRLRFCLVWMLSSFNAS